ncbi:MAG: ATPase domain-containing protein [Candidatus Thorarchaeota archaeon]
MNRVKTGIPGLDNLVGGGFERGSTTLVSGRTGTGKSTLGLQFLHAGATQSEEPGILVTLETRPDDVRNFALGFKWDIRELEKQRLFLMIDASSSKAGLPTSEKYALRRGFDMTTLAEEIYRGVDEYGARRIVIDSLSGLGLRFDEPSETRYQLYRIGALLRELKVTTLFIGETPASESFSIAGVEEYVCQGLIVLYLTERHGVLERSLIVWKMRGSEHSLKRHPFTIGHDGIRVLDH